MSNGVLIKYLHIILLLSFSLYAEAVDSNTTDNNKTDAYQTSSSLHQSGHIFDSAKAYLMYGYEYSDLSITNKIQDPDNKDSEGNIISLADGGKYAFNSIQSKYKKLLLNIDDYDFSYSITGTDISLTTAPWDLPKSDVTNPDDVYYLATEFLGGMWPLKKPNTLLGHESKLSLIYRKAIFEGSYKRNDSFEKIKMNKNQYGIEYISESVPYLITKFPLYPYIEAIFGEPSYMCYKFLYEHSELPQVIYFKNGYEDLDHHFSSHKYTFSNGTDWVTKYFMYGYEIGLGYSSVEPGKAAKKRINDANLKNKVDYSNAVILYGAARLGFNYTLLFKYTSLNINLLYNVQYLSESSSETISDNNNGKMELIYDRSETLQNVKLNATWTF